MYLPIRLGKHGRYMLVRQVKVVKHGGEAYYQVAVGGQQLRVFFNEQQAYVAWRSGQPLPPGSTRVG